MRADKSISHPYDAISVQLNSAAEAAAVCATCPHLEA